MNHDYYALLDIAPAADLAAIKKAYRRKAMECHPDRGGSHEDMVLVNEAWEVLSTPELRARYDEARSRTHDEAAQDRATADSRDANQRARNYPRRWEDFERWLNGVSSDFANARYGSEPIAGLGIPFPTIDNSVSGCLFIAIGAALAGIFISTELADFVERKKIKGMIGMGLIFGPLIAGAWIGAALHQAISQAFKEAEEANARQRQNTQSQEAEKEQGDSTLAPRIIQCEKCNQKLRIPGGQPELLVTCRSCGHKFSCPAG